MLRPIYYSTILFLVFTTSCISKNVKLAAKKSAEMCGAASYSVSRNYLPDFATNNYSGLKLELSDFNDSTIVLEEKNALIIAYSFLLRMEPADYKRYNNIMISLKKGKEVYFSAYKTDQLLKLHVPFNIVSSMLNSICNKSFTGFEEIIDTATWGLKKQQIIYNKFLLEDSLYGPVLGKKIIGLELTKPKNNDEPQTVVWAILEHKDANTNVRCVVGYYTEKIQEISIE